MTAICPADPAYRLRAELFNAISAAGPADRFLPLSVREQLAEAALEAFGGWLAEGSTASPCVAAMTIHDVDEVDGCAHHAVRDCREERARLVLDTLATLAGQR